MMNKITIKIIIYILSLIFLFSIPICLIIENTDTLIGGEEYLFKVEAFDPYDMFRGNYLNINFKERSIEADSNNIVKDDTYFYVTISKDVEGFAYFDNISTSKPQNTSNYFKTTGYYSEYSNSYFIETPNRYYMNEEKSLSAEKTYNENIDNTYVKVRVKNGKMVIVGVYVNDILIDSIS